MSDQPETVTLEDLVPFEGTARRCAACRWPVMHSEFQPERRTQVDGEGGSTLDAVPHLLRKCEQCGYTVREALAAPTVNEAGVTITGT